MYHRHIDKKDNAPHKCCFDYVCIGCINTENADFIGPLLIVDSWSYYTSFQSE